MQITAGGALNTPSTTAFRAQLERDAFKGLDADSNGAGSLDAFKTRLQNLQGGRSAAAGSAEGAFRSIDADGDGQVSETELRSAMRSRGGQRGSQAKAADSAGFSLGGIGNALLAQLFGQGQASAGSSQGDAAEAVQQAQRLVLRQAQGGTVAAA